MGPVNIGSNEMVTINELVDIVANISGKSIYKKHITGPVGVRGRNSDNTLIKEILDWNYSLTLQEGLVKTYEWIQRQLK
jgi:nucleoside-diphosphate-sugar epimerase